MSTVQEEKKHITDLENNDGDLMVDEEEMLIQWTRALDFDEYTRKWTTVGLSNTSKFIYEVELCILCVTTNIHCHDGFGISAKNQTCCQTNDGG